MQRLFIEWNQINETGIPLMDEQHRAIVGLINSFHMLRDMDGSVAVATLQLLCNFADVHFRSEEILLRKYRFPDFEPHQRLHHKIGELMGRAVETEMSHKDLESFLKDWWLTHINVEDRKFADHMVAIGELEPWRKLE